MEWNPKFYMHTCSECGDDAEMMIDDGSCPQCGNVDVTIVPFTDEHKF